MFSHFWGQQVVGGWVGWVLLVKNRAGLSHSHQVPHPRWAPHAGRRLFLPSCISHVPLGTLQGSGGEGPA